MTSIGCLLDKIIAAHDLRTDAALADCLEVDPSYVSRMRHEQRLVGPELILRIHESFDVPIAEIKAAVGARSLSLAPACRVPSKAEALAQFVVKRFAAGMLSQRKAATGSA